MIFKKKSKEELKKELAIYQAKERARRERIKEQNEYRALRAKTLRTKYAGAIRAGQGVSKFGSKAYSIGKQTVEGAKAAYNYSQPKPVRRRKTRRNVRPQVVYYQQPPVYYVPAPSRRPKRRKKRKARSEGGMFDAFDFDF